tara:strand:+ start:12930 stop:13133 length:204 start_codon:yes stop_codon:yes gene_type:complete
MVKAMNEKFALKKKTGTKSTLTYVGENALIGVLYLHEWADNYQELFFESHLDARKWARENKATYQTS